ncbi:MAG: M28 family peptidase [Deltaproteobacteria bacterium]|nr:MAG: M28 family peptidase [Deltaproteobacteria bacterium]
MVKMPGKSFKGPLPQMTEEEQFLRSRLQEHVNILASKIGERNLYLKYTELQEAAHYIEQYLVRQGYEVSSQGYRVRGREVRNIEAVKVGSDLADEIIVIGAHYDSAMGTPGANDNASGVAALLELARLMRDDRPARSVRFVAFVNEEPPYFKTDDMGSMRYAKRCAERNENVVAMLALETIGYYSDNPGSQRYPPGISLFYPDRGNFVAFVGNIGSGSLVRRCVKLFRASTEFPCEGAVMPGWIVGIDWSDHWSFWQEGFKGIMVTDTAPFRYSYYHSPNDTPDKVNYDRTARVVAGLVKVILRLAEND